MDQDVTLPPKVQVPQDQLLHQSGQNRDYRVGGDNVWILEVGVKVQMT